MSASATASLAGITATARAMGRQAGDRWQALAPRERAALTVAGLVLGLFLGWTIAIQPALATLRSAPGQIEQLDSQLQRMQRLASEARELQALPPITTAQASLALKAATDRLGAGAKLVVQGDRATLTLDAVPPDALRSWLVEVRSGARARPVEVRLTQQGPQGYGGSIVLSLAGGGS